AVPAIPAPPLGATEKAVPGTAIVWSRFSDQVRVTVTPSAATVAELMVGAVVSTRKDWVALNEEPAAEESTFLARQRSEERRVGKEWTCTRAEALSKKARLVLVESQVPRELEQWLCAQ